MVISKYVHARVAIFVFFESNLLAKNNIKNIVMEINNKYAPRWNPAPPSHYLKSTISGGLLFLSLQYIHKYITNVSYIIHTYFLSAHKM